jgi:hypothetical protein
MNTAKVVSGNEIKGDDGLSRRERNSKIGHNIPLGTLVEVKKESGIQECGLRLYVQEQNRDCDGTPLYSLTFDFFLVGKDFRNPSSGNEHLDSYLQIANRGALSHGYPEDSLEIIEAAESVYARYAD